MWDHECQTECHAYQVEAEVDYPDHPTYADVMEYNVGGELC